ncbi:MAG: glycine zipper domain-containing protein [Steroidobacteraceae bacterium]|jgi:hypothetical protein
MSNAPMITRFGRRSATLLAGGIALSLLSACVTTPPPLAASPPPPPDAVVAQGPPPPPNPQIFVYPNNGQNAEQLDRDRYECNNWAVKQSGFDPSQSQVPPHERVQVVSMGPPPGANTVAGAATGAVLGAIVSPPRAAGGGALIGALAGAIIGASADAANQQRTEEVQQSYDQRDLQVQARFEQRSRDYRRAISACLEGRGYTVK